MSAPLDNRYTVSVDGGGSGCRLAAFDHEGRVRARAEGGPASLSYGEREAWDNIRDALARLAVALGEPAGWLPARLRFGLAGSLQAVRRERFLAALPTDIDCRLVTDGYAQLLGATGGEPGVCLAVGTGSVVHWLAVDGDLGMAGGWGFPAGDEGSGAWLGLRLVNALLWHRDTHGEAADLPPCLAALVERTGTSVADVQRWSTCTRATELASLAPLVTNAAAAGDALADALLAGGARECERLLARAPGEVPVYLVGGLAAVYGPRLEPRVAARLAPARSDALHGLLRLGRDVSP